MTDRHPSAAVARSVGTADNDSFWFSQFGPTPGDTIVGGAGTDELVLYTGQGYTFSRTLYDFTTLTFDSIEAVRFAEPEGSSTYEAIFSNSQFGDGISTALSVSGSFQFGVTAETIAVFMDAPGAYSAADWSFTSTWRTSEDLVLLVGTSSSDAITAASAPTSINGGDGDDLLIGGQGNDTLDGGAGSDWFVFQRGGGGDVVMFSHADGDGLDLSDFRTIHTLADVLAVSQQAGPNTVITLGAGASVTLVGVAMSDLTAADFQFAQPALGHDLNGDRVGDVALENSNTGQVGVWLLDGDTQPSWRELSFEGAGWRVAGLGDFDNNGNGDVLLENPTTGQVGVWLMVDLQPSWKSVSIAGAGWRVADVGDVNGDGTSDIVLENQTTGQVGLWEMTNGAPTWAPVSTEGAGWHVAPIGDVNGDGTADIVLENPATGQVGVWTMSNNQPTWTSIATEGAGWHVAAAADINGDGTADIVLENANSGMVGVWTMSNGHPTWRYLSSEGAGWHVAAVNDYTDDGRADLLLESDSGATGLWVMQADATVSWKALSEVGSGWHVI